MDEARRTLRHLQPGLLFTSLSFAWIYLLAGNPFSPTLLATPVAIASLIASVIVASGTMGYLLSILHHHLHWRLVEMGMDHSRIVNSLRAQGLLRLHRLPESLEPLKADAIPRLPVDSVKDVPTRRQGWIVLTTLWYSRTQTNDCIKGAASRADSLTDLSHTAGTAWVALGLSVLPAFAAFVLELSSQPPHHGLLLKAGVVLILWSLLFLLLGSSAKHLMALSQDTIDTLISTALAGEFQKTGRPHLVMIPPAQERASVVPSALGA